MLNFGGYIREFFASKVKRVILFLIFTIIPNIFEGLIFNFQNFQNLALLLIFVFQKTILVKFWMG